jgi:hypothetical protein
VQPEVLHQKARSALFEWQPPCHHGCAMAQTPPGLRNRHSPRLVQRPDGRFEIRCPQCERMDDQARPIGIGMPIVNRIEAESIARNHGGRAA